MGLFLSGQCAYHGKILTIVWDKTGKKYNRGKGFMVYVDNKLMIHNDKIKKISFNLENE